MEADVADMIAVADGDQSALGRLYERYAPLMLAVGQRMLKNRREAEDILHDVFVEIWKRAGDFDPGRGTVKTWVLLRMRSRCLDRLKSAGYTRVRQVADVEPHMKGTSDASAERAADGGRLHGAIAALPEAQQAVLLLGYFEGLSCSQIAERLDVPIGTVKSRMAAALAKLRADVAPEEAAG